MSTLGPGTTWDSGAPWDSGIYVWDGSPFLTLQFLDESGVNPLPAGIRVKVFQYSGQPQDISQFPGLPYGTAYTWPEGMVDIQVLPGTTYIAFFDLSWQAPLNPVVFTPVGGVSQLCKPQVPGYASPAFSQPGYANFQAGKLVRGWFGDAARHPGGIAYAIAMGYGEALYDLDFNDQTVLQEMRLPSSVGKQIDSWSLDMVGPVFGRFPSESDPLFITRNEIMVARPRCTINAIQAMVQAFLNSLSGSYVNLGQALAFSVAGAGGYNVSGAFNRTPPPPGGLPPPAPQCFVWDGMTEPGLAATFGITVKQFVIQIGTINASLNQVLAFNVSGAYNVSGGFSVVPTNSVLPTPSPDAPDARLALMVSLLAKAGGTQPIYIVTQSI